MECKLLNVKGTWREVADSARTTVGLEPGTNAVPSSWKRRILLAEHSPIRKIKIAWKWFNLLWWVQTHFTRHHVGVEWWVKTSREDRTGVTRALLTQNATLDMEGEANAQALINIARKRLCFKASYETREAFAEVKNLLCECEPELSKVLVPDCVYRGWCYEMESCGFFKSDKYQNMLNNYRKDINQ